MMNMLAFAEALEELMPPTRGRHRAEPAHLQMGTRFRSRCEATPDNSELSMNVHGLNKSHGWQELHACSADMKGSNVLIQGREKSYL